MKYFKNTSWVLGEKILRMGVGVVLGVWVARYLGPGQFGILSYAISFVGLISVFATLGLDGILIRELVKNGSKRDRLLGTAFGLRLMGAFLVIFMLIVVISLSSNNQETNIIIIIIASANIFQSFKVIDFFFQARVLSKFVVYTNTMSLLISSIIKITLIINEAPLTYFAYVILFDNLVLALGYVIYYYNNNLSITKWRFDKFLARNLLKDSWPLILSGMLVAVYMKIDQVMIKEMLENDAVGQYAAAVKLSESWYFIPMVITYSLFPAIINAKKNDISLYYSRLQRLYDLMVWMAIAIALPMTFMSDWIVQILYGNQYTLTGSVLMIHIWAGVFMFLGVASNKWLLAENLQKFLMANTLIGALLNIALNFTFIPYYGIKGAAWATLISYFVASYLSLSFFKKTRTNFIKLSKSLFFIDLLKSIFKNQLKLII